MRRTFLISRSVLAGGLLMLGLAAGGCGEDRVERGLAPANETATPESKTELGETEKQRDEATKDAMQGRSGAEFDSENAPPK